MEVNQAAEHLQVIRTLMERSAVYRRALAPIMILCGVLGISAGVLGWLLKFEFDRTFLMLWVGTAGAALLGSFLLVRRQALKASEPFWSPPTRRIAQALLPPFFIALFFSLFAVFSSSEDDSSSGCLLVIIWMMLYGCALHSAGFFISRGFQILGWIFCAAGCVLMASLNYWVGGKIPINILMGGLFGGLHLAAGIYLYFTEKRRNES